MPRAVLDENVSLQVGARLAAFGYEVLAIAKQPGRGMSDEAVFALVTESAGLLVTRDTHFTNPLRFPPAKTGGILYLTHGNLAFRVDDEQPNDLSPFVIDQTGNVGIGTANPAAKLEVAGQLKITGGAPSAGKVLTSDANGLATWEPGGALRGVQVFTASGTWNKPLGVTKVIVEVVGGGGGGNSGNSVGCATGGSGGSAGGYAKELIDVTAVSSVPVTVGAGGAGALGGTGPLSDPSLIVGQPGGTSSFGAYLQATGGSSGYPSNYLPGPGGVGSGGLINRSGQQGDAYITNVQLGRAGGSSELGAGGAGSSNYLTPGGTGESGEGPRGGKGTVLGEDQGFDP